MNDKTTMSDGQSCGAAFPIYIDGLTLFIIFQKFAMSRKYFHV